jgi:hypothetical protein
VPEWQSDRQVPPTRPDALLCRSRPQTIRDDLVSCGYRPVHLPSPRVLDQVGEPLLHLFATKLTCFGDPAETEALLDRVIGRYEVGRAPPLPVSAAGPTAGTSLPIIQFSYDTANVICSCFGFFHRYGPADPLVSGEWRKAIPLLERLRVGNERRFQVSRHLMHNSGRNGSILHFHAYLRSVCFHAPGSFSTPLPSV